MTLKELNENEIQAENQKISPLLLLIAVFAALMILGMGLGDYNETLLNGSTL
jgi:hypothetical protein